VISEALRESFEEAVRLRNILVHNYVYVAPREHYATAKKMADTLVDIVGSILGYMQEKNIDP